MGRGGLAKSAQQNPRDLTARPSWRPPKTWARARDLIYCGVGRREDRMVRPVGFFDVEERLAGLSKKGDDLERLAAVVDFELFRPELERAVPRADRSKGGRPPFDHVLMFKVLILQTQNNLSDERTEFYLRDRLTWMRFLGLGLGDPVPDANTIWTFREALTKAGAIERLFALFDQQLRAAGLPRHVRATGRREHRRRAQAAQHQGREAGDQGRPGAGGLAGPSRRSSARRTAMRAGPSRRPRPSRARARRRWSIWRSPRSATRTTSAPIAATG